METIGSYLFWASLYLAIIAVVYAVFVRKTGTPSQNRWFVITGLSASLLFSWSGHFVSGLVAASGSPAGATMLPEVVVNASSGAYSGLENARSGLFEVFASRRILLYIIATVSLLFLLRMLVSLIYLATRIRISKRVVIEGCTVLPVKKRVAPFSFFGCVFIPEELLSGPELKQIILHERAHIRKWHSLDLIFVEALTVLFWFHPGIWYLRKELKMQHEFEADRYVLDQHTDKISYQRLLLDVSFRGFSLPVTNPFNYPSLKKRIMMMNKTFEGSRKRALISMLIAIPMFGTALLIHSCNDETSKEAIDAELEAAAQEAAYATDVIFTVVENPPGFPGGEKARQLFLEETLRYPNSAREEGVQGTVFVSFVVRHNGAITDAEILRGLHPDIDKEVLRVVNKMPRWEPGEQRGEKVSVRFNMPVRFTLLNDETPSGESEGNLSATEALIVIGEEQFLRSGEALNDLDELIVPADIESVRVLRGQEAMDKYGHERVIVIVPKE